MKQTSEGKNFIVVRNPQASIEQSSRYLSIDLSYLTGPYFAFLTCLPYLPYITSDSTPLLKAFLYLLYSTILDLLKYCPSISIYIPYLIRIPLKAIPSCYTSLVSLHKKSITLRTAFFLYHRTNNLTSQTSTVIFHLVQDSLLNFTSSHLRLDTQNDYDRSGRKGRGREKKNQFHEQIYPLLLDNKRRSCCKGERKERSFNHLTSLDFPPPPISFHERGFIESIESKQQLHRFKKN